MWQEAAVDYDSGTIGKTCECKDHECRNSELCACKQCDEAGCPGGKCSPAALMICDMKGNGIEWNELKSGMIVKIRSLHRFWRGYEYLYASVGGKRLFISKKYNSKIYLNMPYIYIYIYIYI